MRAIPSVRATENSFWVGTQDESTEAPTYDHVYEALLVSEGHRRRGGVWIEGGPFFAEKSRLENSCMLEMPSWYYYGVHHGRTRFFGVEPLRLRRVPTVGSDSNGVGRRVIDAVQSNKALQGEYYTRGILRTRPGRPEASLGQFLAELRDFPSVPGRSLLRALRGVPLRGVVPSIRTEMNYFRRAARASGEEYLNFVFGWKPFVQDLQAFYTLCKGIDASIQKLVDENRKNIRRRTSFGTSTVVVPSVAGAGHGSWNQPMVSCGGYSVPPSGTGVTSVSRVTKTTTRTWFVAGYRYHIPNTTSWLWKGRAVAALFGAFPTPELLWNVTPWTWLIDWFEDVGSLAGYFSPTAVDALVTRYAFTMRTTRIVEECVANTRLDPAATSNRQWSGCAGVLRTLRTRVTKQRGTGWAPFGTSQNLPSLNAKQVAILAALGLSRV